MRSIEVIPIVDHNGRYHGYLIEGKIYKKGTVAPELIDQSVRKITIGQHVLAGEKLSIESHSSFYDLEIASDYEKLLSIERWKRFTRSAEHCGVGGDVNAIDLIPSSFLCNVTLSDVTDQGSNSSVSLKEYDSILNTVACAFYRARTDGIKIDRRSLEKDREAITLWNQVRNRIRQDNTVTVSYDVIGGKTRRVSMARSSFNPMNIEKTGSSRDHIISSFEGGKIVSFDYNAIDYRCIMSKLPKLSRLYSGCEDFHSRTVEILVGKKPSPEIRKLFKDITYCYFYGATRETCSKTTGLSLSKVDEILSMFDSKLVDVISLRDEFQHITDSLIDSPFGKIDVSSARNRGHALALVAQTMSAECFKRALAFTNTECLLDSKSYIIFTVHDEAALDVHPDEFHLIDRIKKTLQTRASIELNSDIEFSVRVSIGDSYGKMSDRNG